MPPRIQSLMDKQAAGERLGHDELMSMMAYLKDLMTEFNLWTQASMQHAKNSR